MSTHPYEYKWIIGANLPHTKLLINAFEAKKLTDSKVAVTAKAVGKITR